MTFDSHRFHRQSMRLRGYDYTRAGAYFVTLCTYGRVCLLGDVIEGVIRLTALGEIVAEEWVATAAIRKEIALDEWIVMPNHLHAIVHLCGRLVDDDPFDWLGSRTTRSATVAQRSPESLGSLISGFKSATTKRINASRRTRGALVWQRGYYDHIIRNENALARIRRYIVDNPARWAADPDNPANIPSPRSENDRHSGAGHRSS